MTPHYTKLVLEAGNLIRKARSKNRVSEILTECTNLALQPDLCCLYSFDKNNCIFNLTIKKGYPAVSEFLSYNSELIQFLNESRELVCLNRRKNSPFQDILLADQMESGLAVSIVHREIMQWVLIVNSVRPFFFKENELSFLENIGGLT